MGLREVQGRGGLVYAEGTKKSDDDAGHEGCPGGAEGYGSHA
jgi:hypothetical protein